MPKLGQAVGVAGLAIITGLAMKSVPTMALVSCVAVALVVVLLAFLVSRSVRCLGQDEQLRVVHLTETTVHNGPGLQLLNPCSYRSAEVRKATVLGKLDYAKVADAMRGEERIERGPQLLFLGPHDRVVHTGAATSLSSTEYVTVEDRLSGEKSVVQGPCIWFPGPHEQGHKDTAISLKSTEYLHVEQKLTGELSKVQGPCIWFPGPYDLPSRKQTAIALQDDEYVLLKDASSGQRWVHRGKGLVFLEPTWKVDGAGPAGPGVRKAWVLKAHEYLRLLDVSTGKVSVHRGEAKVFPGPDEELVPGYPKTAVQIDGEHAALVRDQVTGQLRLETEKQLFVPGPNETVEEVRELIKLADHEAMIIKDKDGAYQYYYGSDTKRSPDQPRSFFLPPHAEIVKVFWSRGPRRERKDVSFERFDCRPHFMKFEFNCRTSDNVELVLEGVAFWELLDLPAMWRHTGDTSGDMVYHLRSQFIQQVSRVTLRVFMETLHGIARTILDEDEEFFATRGIKVHSLEMTRYQCADKSTASILEQIIQETTNRMNRLSQAESENEVNVFRTQGQVQEMRLKSDLLDINREQEKAAALTAGASEADRVATFIRGLAEEVPNLEDRIKMWQVLRKTEALSVVSTGGANLYFTPNDVDLSIETRAPSSSQTAPAT